MRSNPFGFGPPDETSYEDVERVQALPGVKVAIVGSRNYPRLKDVRDCVKKLPEGTVVISGAARGVDQEAAKAARKRGLEVVEFPAKWRDAHGRFNRLAGFERNKQIVAAADLVVAFRYKMSAGTSHTVREAQAVGKLKAVKDI